MRSPYTILAGLAATSTTVSAEHLRAAFSTGGFSGIGGTGYYMGFAIIRDNGDAIYNDGTPNDHSPCFETDGGRFFTIGGSCWNTTRTFHCLSNVDEVRTCSVDDENGNVLSEGTGMSDTTWIGISVGIDSTCVVEFESDDASECPVDDGNGPLHVTDDGWDPK
ncbi:hypothetical protein BJY04DRAFT_219790 [Aspergillus karnatakaensis]|uniref:uncharacterized protein n=1 Tax=Aspergillus karnatakaensis TaxID=1810916 RepID=UPI003CCD59E3